MKKSFRNHLSSSALYFQPPPTVVAVAQSSGLFPYSQSLRTCPELLQSLPSSQIHRPDANGDAEQDQRRRRRRHTCSYYVRCSSSFDSALAQSTERITVVVVVVVAVSPQQEKSPNLQLDTDRPNDRPANLIRSQFFMLGKFKYWLLNDEFKWMNPLHHGWHPWHPTHSLEAAHGRR